MPFNIIISFISIRYRLRWKTFTKKKKLMSLDNKGAVSMKTIHSVVIRYIIYNSKNYIYKNYILVNKNQISLGEY